MKTMEEGGIPGAFAGGMGCGIQSGRAESPAAILSGQGVFVLVLRTCCLLLKPLRYLLSRDEYPRYVISAKRR